MFDISDVSLPRQQYYQKCHWMSNYWVALKDCGRCIIFSGKYEDFKIYLFITIKSLHLKIIHVKDFELLNDWASFLSGSWALAACLRRWHTESIWVYGFVNFFCTTSAIAASVVSMDMRSHPDIFILISDMLSSSNIFESDC